MPLDNLLGPGDGNDSSSASDKTYSFKEEDKSLYSEDEAISDDEEKRQVPVIRVYDARYKIPA